MHAPRQRRLRHRGESPAQRPMRVRTGRVQPRADAHAPPQARAATAASNHPRAGAARTTSPRRARAPSTRARQQRATVRHSAHLRKRQHQAAPQHVCADTMCRGMRPNPRKHSSRADPRHLHAAPHPAERSQSQPHPQMFHVKHSFAPKEWGQKDHAGRTSKTERTSKAGPTGQAGLVGHPHAPPRTPASRNARSQARRPPARTPIHSSCPLLQLGWRDARIQSSDHRAADDSQWQAFRSRRTRPRATRREQSRHRRPRRARADRRAAVAATASCPSAHHPSARTASHIPLARTSPSQDAPPAAAHRAPAHAKRLPQRIMHRRAIRRDKPPTTHATRRAASRASTRQPPTATRHPIAHAVRNSAILQHASRTNRRNTPPDNARATRRSDYPRAASIAVLGILFILNCILYASGKIGAP